jgi:hypothetical protein
MAISKPLPLDLSKIEIQSPDSSNNNKGKDVAGNTNAQVTGRRTNLLEQAFKDYEDSINRAARNNDGTVSQRPADKLKGNILEAQQKASYNVDAAAKGKGDKTHASMGGDKLSDGEVISKTDPTTDIVTETKKNPWSKTKQDPYQAKSGDSAQRELDNPKYDDVDKVAPSDQVSDGNTRIKSKVGGKEISSEEITSPELDKLTEDARNQNAKYLEEKKQQKRKELNRLNLIDAAKTGALIGGISVTISEIIKIVKNGELTKEQFVESVKNIIINGIVDGAARSTTIVAATQLFNVAKNSISLEAVPVMAAANVAFDLAKDLYKFACGNIEADVLLCNTVENSIKSLATFSGGYLGGLGATAAISAITGADMAAVGAGIGAPFGPIGIIIGSVVGGVIIGGVVNIAIKDAKEEAYAVFNRCLKNVRNEIERDPSRRVYIFADAMSHLEKRDWSFKSLIPGHNFISDMTEYNLKKRAIQEIHTQMDRHIASAKKAAYERLMAQYEAQCKDIEEQFLQQKSMMESRFKSDIDDYIKQSYVTYVTAHNEIGQNIQQSIKCLEKQKIEQNEIIRASEKRVEANKQINKTINEFMKNLGKDKDVKDSESIKEFIDIILQIVKSDKLLINKQYISFDETLELLETA